MNLMTPARLAGALFFGLGLGMLLLTCAGLRFVGMFSPLTFVIGTWLATMGAYQAITNTTSTTPPEEIPKWWVPGLVALSIVSLGGPCGLVVYVSF